MNTSNRDKSHYDFLKYSLKAQHYIIAGAFQLVTLLFKNGSFNTTALKFFRRPFAGIWSCAWSIKLKHSHLAKVFDATLASPHCAPDKSYTQAC